MIALVRQREITKRESLLVDRTLFEQRNDLRQLKRNLPAPYKEGDEDLLINQKVRNCDGFAMQYGYTDPCIASEEKATGSNNNTGGRSYSTADPGTCTRACHRNQLSGFVTRYLGSEGERNSKRDQTENPAAPKMERELCGHDACATVAYTGRQLQFKLPCSNGRILTHSASVNFF